jgi:hypothetical protein
MSRQGTRSSLLFDPSMHRAVALILVASTALLGACAASAVPTPSASAETTPSAALADLDALLEQLELIHPEPWHGIAREEWVAALDALKARYGELSSDEGVVELTRLVARLSRAGRDGHQFAIPADGAEGSYLPFRVYEFEEGLFITQALAPSAELAGARITAVGGHPIGEVLDALEPLVPRDGPQTVHDFRPVFFVRVNVLHGLGLIGEGDVPLTVADSTGAERAVSVAPVPFATYVAQFEADAALRLPSRDDTLYLSDYSQIAWSRYLPESRTLYLRYSEVGDLDGLDSVVRDRGAQPDVDRVVLDLRQNPGGDNHDYLLLLGALQAYAGAHPGRLFVLTDRITFSAASNLATEIEQTTDTTFVGEAMGGGLNFWDDVRWVDLPNLPVPMRVGVSTRYWQKSSPDDPRLTIDPDLPVPVRAADYFAGVDPALEAATTR